MRQGFVKTETYARFTSGVKAVEARGAAEGWGPQQIAAARREVASNVRARTIIGMAASQPFKAWEYYQDFGDELTAVDRERVEQVMDLPDPVPVVTT